MENHLTRRPTFVSVTPYRARERKAMVWFGELDDSIPAPAADNKLTALTPVAPKLLSVSKSLSPTWPLAA